MARTSIFAARLALAGTLSAGSAIGLAISHAAAADTWSSVFDVSPASTSETTGATEVILPDGDRLVLWIHDTGVTEQLKYRRWDATTDTWSPLPQNLTGTNSDLADPGILISDAGVVSAVWRQRDGSDDVVHTRRLPAGSFTWGPDTTISATGSSASGVSAVVDPNGVVTVGWRATSPGVQRTTVVRSNPGAQTWGSPVALTVPGQLGRTPVLATTGLGDAMALFGIDVGPDVELRAARFSTVADQWDTPDPLQDEAGINGDSVSQTIVGLDDGSYVAAWVRREPAGWSVVASRYVPGPGWSPFDPLAGTESLVTLDSGGELHDLIAVPSVAGGALVAWVRSQDGTERLIAARMDASGTFLPGQTLFTSSNEAIAALVGVGDTADNVTLAWTTDVAGSTQHTSVVRRAGDVWQDATTVSSPFGAAYTPSLALRPADAVDVLWTENGIVRLSTLVPSPPPAWLDEVLGPLRVGVPLVDGVLATGTPAPTYSVTAGALPAGLTLNPATGVVTGTPTAAGSFDVTVRASNLGGAISTRLTGSVEPAVPFYVPVTPVRLFDTRAGESPDALRDAGTLPVGPDHTIEVKVSDLPGGITPATGVAAVSLNVVATGSTQDGYVVVWDCATRPFAANLNHSAGQTIGNAVIAPVSPTGTICLWAMTNTHVIADLNGWFPTS